MDSELAALASSGATTLVGLMVSDAWAQVRDRVTGFFTRRGQTSTIAEQLAASRQELMAAQEEGDPDVAADTQAMWRTHLRRALLSDPDAAGELRALLADLEPMAGQGTTAIHIVVSGGTQNGPVVQSQNIWGLTFHSAPPNLPSVNPDYE
ncbi:hypothetical protein [Actinacidiphila acididurans]|uniref:Uncharacterized protein n=1 Tax=Actinacidiphila acididurans TaxID=2784346 RepID=A0ABS2TTV6_9ACTN|nr:hypothetical protein [Actinacidiphila acididurans]MBM9506777.1 hypothetical protein [Actinacidiphila acididurans]